MPKFRLVLTTEYNINKENYPGCETLKEMADLDLQNFEDPDILMEYLSNVDDYSVKVEVI